MQRRFLSSLALAAIIAVPLGSVAQAAVPVDSSALRSAVTVDGVREHQLALQAIADANGGSRVAGSPGYEESVQYVADSLAAAGYDVEIQPFSFEQFLVSDVAFDRVSPDPRTYVEGFNDDFNVAEYSGSGNVTAPIEAVDVIVPIGSNPDNTSTSGCEAADFNGFTAGRIAVVQRGSCDFSLKASNAEAAGATGVIIFNEGQEPDRSGTINATLSIPGIVSIPVFDTTYAIGAELVTMAQSGEVIVHMQAATELRTTDTWNVIAETDGGRTDRVVLLGAHLDSVAEGPGINDNGSGSAVVLEIAEQIAALGVEPRNQIRFAFWGGEEAGLFGSQYYVDTLPKTELKNISVNLNFDMLGSPNFVRFVYDGDGSATGTRGPSGSGNVEQVFLDYFASQGLPVEPTEFDGRSDYGAFIGVGIPAGGLFSGAEGIKTADQAAIYGGTVGDQYDPCYHLSCDTYANNSNVVLDQFADAAAHATMAFAMTTSAVNGTDKASEKAKANGQALTFRGSKAVR
jgi:Zn-dependent M28 family amino/carboxypeptidase